MNLPKLASSVLLLCASTCAFSSTWIVDNQHSELNFISVKKENIAEVHQFKNIEGSLDSQGDFSLTIDLNSVDTHNLTRDERMKNFFFEVDKFTTATLTANIDATELEAIAEGASRRMSVDSTLDLHGMKKDIVLDVVVTRLVGAKLSVTSVKPVIVSVDDFALVSGLEKLRELAKLPSISHAVPVSFYLTLNLKK